MKNRVVFVFILSFCSLINHAQEIYLLHTQVGDTITKNDAFTNHIFQDIKLPDYHYAVIYKLQKKYRVDFCYDNIINPIFMDQVKMDAYNDNIEKITAYLNRKTDTTDTNVNNLFKDRYVSKSRYQNNKIIFFSKDELKNIGLSGFVLTKEGRASLEKEEEKKSRLFNKVVHINNELINIGNTDAILQFTNPILRKNKVIKKAKEDANSKNNK